eukprot:2597477-Pyramimonas_sp.AAC.1
MTAQAEFEPTLPRRRHGARRWCPAAARVAQGSTAGASARTRASSANACCCGLLGSCRAAAVRAVQGGPQFDERCAAKP